MTFPAVKENMKHILNESNTYLEIITLNQENPNKLLSKEKDKRNRKSRMPNCQVRNPRLGCGESFKKDY